jgi:MFS transporter, PPP family, 3-phenylpropionic acid transporter
MAHKPQLSTDRFALKLGLFYAAYFLFGGIQLPFFPLWLEAKGLDAGTIGVVIAVPMIARIVAVPIITRAADRRRAIKATLVIIAAIGALAMTLVGLVQGAVAILVAFTVAAVAFAPMLSLSDAYALNGLGARGRAYGPVRLWGSVAFIVANIGAGFLLGIFDPVYLIWLIVAALICTMIAAVLLDPLDASLAPTDQPQASPRQLWSNQAFLAVAAAASLTQGSHALYYGFSTMEWRAAGIGGTTIGVLWAIGVLAEIVLFAFSARLPLSPAALLMVGAAGAILRWGAMAFDPPTAALPVLQILHAASFGAAHLGAMGFLARAVPKELAATAQGLVATVSGIVMASATGVSGLIYAASGSLAYLAMAAMGLAGFACALMAHGLARQSQSRDS